jgi:hypothetical protein
MDLIVLNFFILDNVILEFDAALSDFAAASDSFRKKFSYTKLFFFFTDVLPK